MKSVTSTAGPEKAACAGGRRNRRPIFIAAVMCCFAEVSAMAQGIVSFEADAVGGPPKGWTATKTGTGNPQWTVEEDATAPSHSRIVKQSGNATFPVLLKSDTNIKDGFIEVKFKPIAGAEDRAAGVVWRAKDADNYYVLRANALEDNVVLYKTVNGVRRALDIIGRTGGYGVKIAVPANRWGTLRVEFKDSHFKAIYNGQEVFEVEDRTFAEAGMVGLWTKADSVTLFDAILYGESN
jgi:3-keto-disaccharide hydrolase